MAGDFRLRFGGGGAEIADAQFSCPTEQHDDGEPRFVGEGFEEVEVEHGCSCRCDFYMRLIIYVLVAREKIRLEKGYFRQQKTHLCKWVSENNELQINQ
jgi:hypothetical protein